MTMPRQPSSLFELQFPQSVGIYNTYADAQKAVDYLSDEKFEVQNLAIVGTDLKSVERVLGRRNWGTVITQGLQSGISTGLLVGLVVFIFTSPRSFLLLLIAALAIGIVLSVGFAAAAPRSPRPWRPSMRCCASTRWPRRRVRCCRACPAPAPQPSSRESGVRTHFTPRTRTSHPVRAV